MSPFIKAASRPQGRAGGLAADRRDGGRLAVTNQPLPGPGTESTWAPVQVVAVYLLVAGAWILLSDQLLLLLAPDPAAYARLQTYKGWFFVGFTGLLLYALVRRAMERLTRVDRARADSLLAYRELADSIGHVFVAMDHQMRFTYWNRAAEEATGITPQGALGRGLVELFPHLAGGPVEQCCQRVLASGRAETIPWEREQAGGEPVPLEISVYPASHGLSLTAQDLSQARRTERERLRLAAALEQATEGVAIADQALRIVYANPSYLALRGCAAENLLGRDMDLPRDEEGQAIRAQVLERGQAWSGVLGVPRLEGGVLQAEVTISPVRDGHGRVVNHVRLERDVTQELEMERQLRRSQKMEAMGTLAGGVAHDFNNILAAMVGYSELAAAEVDPGGQVAHCLEQVLLAAARARELVARILTFSRQAEQHPEPLDLPEEVAQALALLRASLPASVSIESRLEGPLVVLADRTQVHQVVMNLCTNAAQAMGGTGSLWVTLARRSLKGQETGLDLPAGDYAALTVRDSGPGVAPQVRERIFDPFFTTKGPGDGTGLGLAMVHGIIKASGGSVRLLPGRDMGATFEVLLPLVEGRPAPPPPGLSAPRGQGEMVLVVDDEPALVEMETRILERLGYRVRGTGSPGVALEWLRADPGSFDLLLTDQTMPDLTGLELARALRDLAPRVAVVLLTGHSEKVTSENVSAAGVARLLYKPVGRAELAQAVREVLDGRE